MYIEFCQKLNQIIYNMLDTICGPNIMILAQTILQICIWLTRFEMFFFYETNIMILRRKRGIIQSNIQRILRKFNQVICMPDIMILAHAVL